MADFYIMMEMLGRDVSVLNGKPQSWRNMLEPIMGLHFKIPTCMVYPGSRGTSIYKILVAKLVQLSYVLG